MARKISLSKIPTLLLALLFLFVNSSLAAKYDVSSYGAKADGSTDSTKAFLAAWADACASTQAATIYVPSGRFLLGSAAFSGQCNNNAITMQIDGTLVAPADYNVIGNADNWLLFDKVDGVSIFGGVLDGQGTDLWACKNSGNSCPSGATSLQFSSSKNVMVSGLASLNSQKFHIVIHDCQNMKVQGVKVTAAGDSPNTDGIHVSESSDITILNSKIGTGDDCISIGPGATNLWIESIACGPGHGISVGSLGRDESEAGVQNVTVTTATFTGTENGVRIKSWAQPSNGFARNILFQHAVMNNVQNPIIIDQHYCPSKSCSGGVSGVKVSDVKYVDIHGSSATEVALKFDCSSEYPCTGITLEDVMLTYNNQQAEALCTHADGTASGLVQPTGCL